MLGSWFMGFSLSHILAWGIHYLQWGYQEFFCLNGGVWSKLTSTASHSNASWLDQPVERTKYCICLWMLALYFHRGEKWWFCVRSFILDQYWLTRIYTLHTTSRLVTSSRLWVPVTSSRLSVNQLQLPVAAKWRPWFSSTKVLTYDHHFPAQIFSLQQQANATDCC